MEVLCAHTIVCHNKSVTQLPSLQQAHPNSICLLFSGEIISAGYYRGVERNRLIAQTIFRMVRASSLHNTPQSQLKDTPAELAQHARNLELLHQHMSINVWSSTRCRQASVNICIRHKAGSHSHDVVFVFKVPGRNSDVHNDFGSDTASHKHDSTHAESEKYPALFGSEAWKPRLSQVAIYPYHPYKTVQTRPATQKSCWCHHSP